MSLVTASKLAKTYRTGDVDILALRGGRAKEFLYIGNVFKVDVAKMHGTFDVARCAKCGEAVFVTTARLGANGENLCVPCAGYVE
ncbi:MAG: hypothetical protein ACYC9J_13070 [Sulfuricaulis sp.]